MFEITQEEKGDKNIEINFPLLEQPWAGEGCSNE